MELVWGALIVSVLLIVALIPASIWKLVMWAGLLWASVWAAYLSCLLILHEYNRVI